MTLQLLCYANSHSLIHFTLENFKQIQKWIKKYHKPDLPINQLRQCNVANAISSTLLSNDYVYIILKESLEIIEFYLEIFQYASLKYKNSKELIKKWAIP